MRRYYRSPVSVLQLRRSKVRRKCAMSHFIAWGDNVSPLFSIVVLTLSTQCFKPESDIKVHASCCTCGAANSTQYNINIIQRSSGGLQFHHSHMFSVCCTSGERKVPFHPRNRLRFSAMLVSTFYSTMMQILRQAPTFHRSTFDGNIVLS